MDTRDTPVLTDMSAHIEAKPLWSAARFNTNLHSGAAWANRKPMLLFLLSGLFLLRLAARTFCGLLFQDPPRKTRLAIRFRWLPV